MKEMALHILDIIQNSIRAEATCIILRSRGEAIC